jgi:glycosyltransferase involved in cell wall biosynthesis
LDSWDKSYALWPSSAIFAASPKVIHQWANNPLQLFVVRGWLSHDCAILVQSLSMIANDNKVVHGMWVGTHLSRLELLTLHSFAQHGHEFHLWAYDDLSKTALPPGVRLRDAEKIIPRRNVFAKTRRDRETGVGKNSYGAPFSDLFRFKLLFEHGGIWVDMDVTCLRPFDFKNEYAFRPHRVGVVGSILKCPKGSKLMRRIYEETAATVDADSDYLTPNRILSKHVEDAGLMRCVVADISNPDSWFHFIRPLIERRTTIPDEWYAIHWINEMWRTFQDDGGLYRGKRLLEYIPDKDAPRVGSTLWEMYRKYRLIDPWTGPSGRLQPPSRITKGPGSLPVVSFKEQSRAAAHLNILLPSLVRGGAERIAIETVSALRKSTGLTQRLFVVYPSRRQYPVDAGDNLKITYGDGGADVATTMRAFALEIVKTSLPIVYTHLISAHDLRHFWEMGISTIPIVHNARPGWIDPPTAYDNPRVPFVVAVADAVADDLRRSECPKPVVTIRHELQRFYLPEELSRQRREIRDRLGIADDTLLIGMVGQFKSQKAYTRAVRVLHRVRQFCPAKLLILGGWDNECGGGRAAYEATCRRAVDLGVIADMIMSGNVHPIDPYFAAFDVYMNTSVYEGLSVALLEAIQTGCPILTADAGGNREILPADAVLVKDGADIELYVKGVLELAETTERAIPKRPVEPTLVPQLWLLLAKYGVVNSVSRPGPASGTLFVTDNLNIGGPQQSLVNLLSQLPRQQMSAICMLQGQVSAAHKTRLDDAQIRIFSAQGTEGAIEKGETILNWMDTLNVRNLCFWNVSPEVKLTVTKVLSARDIRIIDVSPGPMLFDELEASEPFQKRVSLTTRQYFDRLDGFVAKYASGAPPPGLMPDRSKIHVIPNGVLQPPSFVPLPPAEFLLPRHLDPALAIGTCCRIVPDKRIEFLLETMQILSSRSPGTSLTIVGGPDARSVDYFEALVARAREEGLTNIFFVGEHDNVMPFLNLFRIFVMAAGRQGCPNASLEAMAMGLPIVANASGGVAEQIEDGINGFLVSSPMEMADRIVMLQKNKRLYKKFATAGRNFALTRFSIERMVNAYTQLLGDFPHQVAPLARRGKGRLASTISSRRRQPVRQRQTASS